MTTLQELQKRMLQLPAKERWQLAQALLESLKQETHSRLKPRNLSRLRGIAKSSTVIGDLNPQEDYVTYLAKKYQ